MKIWMRRSKSIISMWQSSVIPITRVDGYGNAGRLKKRWKYIKANDCVVISDEIWSDLILEGYHHTPAQSVSEDARNRTVAMYAPSKTFNLAGWWEVIISFTIPIFVTG